MKEKQLSAIVKGRVQGVYYRVFTQQEAEKLGLKGYVKNLSNGDVKVFAMGNETSVSALLQWLYKGPTHAIVEKIEYTMDEIQDKDPEENYSHFQVIR